MSPRFERYSDVTTKLLNRKGDENQMALIPK